MTKNKAINIIRKLLELSNNNTSEEEATSAMLKAQELMVKHDVHVEYSEDEIIEYAEEMCNTKWNMGFRKPLAQVIGPNFRCRLYIKNGSIVFVGRANDATIAKDVFEYAYAFAMKEANKAYNKAAKEGVRTKGVYNSYTLGFIHGIKEKFDEQCVALAIVTPPDVNEKFEEITKNFKTSRSGLQMNGINNTVYEQGKTDGRVIMNGRRLDA